MPKGQLGYSYETPDSRENPEECPEHSKQTASIW